MNEGTKENRKSKVPGIVFAVLGALFLLAGVAMILAADNFDLLEKESPVDVYYATETDEYSFALVQYMTESIVYYEAMENMQFYIVWDREWNPAVICLHSDDLSVYQPYIDWLYSESYENEPEEMTVTGYSQPYDAELTQWVTDAYNEILGEEIVDEANFSEWFGEYYLQVGQKNSAYTISKAGIYILLVAVILLVISGVLLYEKKDDVDENMNGAIIEEPRVGLGIMGALAGAILGGLLWTIVGALGYIVGWIGILIIVFAYTGFKIFEHRKEKLGLVVSIIFSLLVVVPATYLTYGWSYYCSLNETISGYTTLSRALQELAIYMTTYDEWSVFMLDLLKGYAFMIIAGGYMLFGTLSNNKKNKL